ncbi:hypothetical protein DV515_00012077, partial [Chloebia gouldiae]
SNPMKKHVVKIYSSRILTREKEQDVASQDECLILSALSSVLDLKVCIPFEKVLWFLLQLWSYLLIFAKSPFCQKFTLSLINTQKLPVYELQTELLGKKMKSSARPWTAIAKQGSHGVDRGKPLSTTSTGMKTSKSSTSLAFESRLSKLKRASSEDMLTKPGPAAAAGVSRLKKTITTGAILELAESRLKPSTVSRAVSTLLLGHAEV